MRLRAPTRKWTKPLHVHKRTEQLLSGLACRRLPKILYTIDSPNAIPFFRVYHSHLSTTHTHLNNFQWAHNLIYFILYITDLSIWYSQRIWHSIQSSIAMVQKLCWKLREKQPNSALCECQKIPIQTAHANKERLIRIRMCLRLSGGDGGGFVSLNAYTIESFAEITYSDRIRRAVGTSIYGK